MTVKNKIPVDVSAVGRAAIRQQVLGLVRKEGYEPDEGVAFWQAVAAGQHPDGHEPVLVIGDLDNLVGRFKNTPRPEWAMSVRSWKPLFVGLVRTQADSGHVADVDELLRASDLRLWICKLQGRGTNLRECLVQAIRAGRPDSLTDVRYDQQRDLLFVQFGDGLLGTVSWSHLGMGDLMAELESNSATVADTGGALVLRKRDGGEFEIDAAAIRSVLDERFREQLRRRHVPADELVGRRLRDRRKLRCLTQIELAKKTGMDQAVISRLERGRHRPRLDTLGKLASALGLTVGELLSA